MLKRLYDPPIPQDHLQEFFERTGRMIGLLAIALPVATGLCALFGVVPMRDSISHFYYTRWAGDFVVGALFYIGITIVFLYHTKNKKIIGWSNLHKIETHMMRCIGMLAVLVAFFPATKPGGPAPDGEILRSFTQINGTPTFFELTHLSVFGTELGGLVHNIAATLMFILLFYFLAVVFPRDQRSKAGAPPPQVSKKKERNAAYAALALLMLFSMFVMGWDALIIKTANDVVWQEHNITYVFEGISLAAFGIGWLIKGRAFPAYNDS